jgi:hypothetical protein
MFVLAFVTMSLSLILTVQSLHPQCKKVTEESPVLGTVFLTMNGGRIKSIRGVVLYPGGEVMNDAIVEVFDNPLKASAESISYAEVNQITNSKRRVACLTGKDGAFRFAKLPSGRYLLRIGHRSDSQFSAAHVVVILDPLSKRSSSKRLTVELVMSI